MKKHLPANHPRYASLQIREKIIKGFQSGLTATAGLFAHGRGEAFDYILGERTLPPVKKAVEAAAALLITAQKPVISVNGNLVALAPKETVRLAKLCQAELEVNLFYRSFERERAIAAALKKAGALRVLGVGRNAKSKIPGLSSARRKVAEEGIYQADVVFLALEDGDRTEQLKKMGKKIIAIDLNPFSRTAQFATITLVDNVVRILPLLIEQVKVFLEQKDEQRLAKIIKSYNNKKNLKLLIKAVYQGLKLNARKGIFLEIPRP